MLFLHSCSDRRKRLNHFVGYIASIPFFTEYNRHWRDGHVTHHLRPCEEDDPQNPDPLYGPRLLKTIAKVWLMPFGFMPVNPSAKYDGKLKRIGLGSAFLLPILALIYSLNPLSLLVLYIAFNTLATLNLCKIAQEHGAGLANEPYPILRSRTYFYPLQWLFSPFNIHYHYEHHANFNVPWYLLPSYHKVVREIIPLELRHHFIHREYWAQMMGTKPLPEWQQTDIQISS
jgi:fatty acid desaturase